LPACLFDEEKKMKGLLIALPYFLLVHNTVDFGPNGAREAYKNRFNCVMTEYIDTLEEENNLRLVSNTGEFGDKINKISLQFESTYSYDLSETRNLVLGLLETLLTTINSNSYLHPYLPNCALTSENIEIRVHFIGICKYDYPNPNDIQYVVLKDEWIAYYVVNPRNLFELEKIREEPLRLAKVLAPSVLYSKDCSPP
jgi:hypothetical protein